MSLLPASKPDVIIEGYCGDNAMLPFLLFLMTDTTAAPAPPPVQEKLICKREPVTGSLARFRKICKTEAQWKGVEDHSYRETATLQDHGLINSCEPDRVC
jgi:hypothetical protein